MSQLNSRTTRGICVRSDMLKLYKSQLDAYQIRREQIRDELKRHRSFAGTHLALVNLRLNDRSVADDRSYVMPCLQPPSPRIFSQEKPHPRIQPLHASKQLLPPQATALIDDLAIALALPPLPVKQPISSSPRDASRLLCKNIQHSASPPTSRYATDTKEELTPTTVHISFSSPRPTLSPVRPETSGIRTARSPRRLHQQPDKQTRSTRFYQLPTVEL